MIAGTLYEHWGNREPRRVHGPTHTRPPHELYSYRTGRSFIPVSAPTGVPCNLAGFNTGLFFQCAAYPSRVGIILPDAGHRPLAIPRRRGRNFSVVSDGQLAGNRPHDVSEWSPVVGRAPHVPKHEADHGPEAGKFVPKAGN